jgi:hypothetical protein
VQSVVELKNVVCIRSAVSAWFVSTIASQQVSTTLFQIGCFFPEVDTFFPEFKKVHLVHHVQLCFWKGRMVVGRRTTVNCETKRAKSTCDRRRL